MRERFVLIDDMAATTHAVGARGDTVDLASSPKVSLPHLPASDDSRTDRQLVSDATIKIGIPRTDVPPQHESFVVRAPLELLARSTRPGSTSRPPRS